jgi:hypothetical protein
MLTKEQIEKLNSHYWMCANCHVGAEIVKELQDEHDRLQKELDDLKQLLIAPKRDSDEMGAKKCTLYLQGKEYDIPLQMYESWMKIQEIERENKELKERMESIREWVDFWSIDINETSQGAYKTIVNLLK